MLSRQTLAVGAALCSCLPARPSTASRRSAAPKPGIPKSRASPARDCSATRRRPAEWASLTIQPVTERGFRAEHVTEGKIAIDEDRSTPVFSPYAGRVTKLLARPGDSVVKGQPLFVIEAADNVQAQNDFIARDDRHEQGEVRARSGADAGHSAPRICSKARPFR